MQQLGDDRVRHGVIDLLTEEDDAVVQQAGVDVVAALATRRLLDDIGYERRIGCFQIHMTLLVDSDGYLAIVRVIRAG